MVILAKPAQKILFLINLDFHITTTFAFSVFALPIHVSFVQFLFSDYVKLRGLNFLPALFDNINPIITLQNTQKFEMTHALYSRSEK